MYGLPFRSNCRTLRHSTDGRIRPESDGVSQCTCGQLLMAGIAYYSTPCEVLVLGAESFKGNNSSFSMDKCHEIRSHYYQK